MGATLVQRVGPEVAQNLGVTFGKELLLIGFKVSPSPVVKGKPAVMETVWKCLARPSRNWRIWTAIDYYGSPQRRLNAGHYPGTPTREWVPGKYYVDRLVFVIPMDFKGGAYTVSHGVFFPTPNGHADYLSESVAATGQRLGVISVALSRGEERPGMWPESREPAVAERLSVAFGKEILLVGYTVKPSPVRKGKPATLEVVWRCLAKPSHDWRLWNIIEDLGPPYRQINLQHPLALPVGSWEPGKYYRDTVEFSMPANYKPGKYRVSIGVFPPFKTRVPYPPEKVMPGGKRYGTLEVGSSRS